MASFKDIINSVSKKAEQNPIIGAPVIATGLPLLNQILKTKNPLARTDTSKQDEAAEAALKQIQDAYAGITPPELTIGSPEALSEVQGYNPVLMAELDKIGYNLADPRLAELSRLGETSFKDISVDPRLKDSQYGALAQLEEIVKGGGLSAKDKADLARVQADVAQADRGRREAVLQNLGARGMAGSGMELLSQLQSNQAATDRASQAGLDIAGMAQQRALDAIMQQGSLAGGMRSQDYGEQAKLAAARDAIAQFNVQNANANALANAQMGNQFALQRAQGQMAAQQANVGNQLDVARANTAAQNVARQQSFQNAQDIANRNVEARNQAAQRRELLPQQTFANQLSVAAGKAGSAQPAVNFYDQQANRLIQEDASKRAAIVGLLSGAAAASAKSQGG